MTLKTLLTDERSKKYTLAARDWIWASSYTVFSAVITAIAELIIQGGNFGKKELFAAAGVGAMIGLKHIARKFLTGPKQ